MSRDFAQSPSEPRHDSFVEDRAYTRSKKLIVCCDGTWQDSDNGYVKGKWGQRGHLVTPTNVTRIARAISAEDDSHHSQIVYYQAGVGTAGGPMSQLMGGGTGVGLEENIREAYSFLASNYRGKDHELHGIAPDKIFLIGFSRGAYTARSIGGLLGAIGLLKKTAMPHFYEIFSDWMRAGDSKYTPLFFDSYLSRHKDVTTKAPSLELAHDKHRIDDYVDVYFRQLLAMDLTQEVDINCIGVWDTVGSLGVPINPVIQKLMPFMPSYFRDYRWFDTRLDNHIKHAFHAMALDERRYPFSPTLWERRKGCRTELKQVWFPGSHSNVGGSYADTGIADTTLAWMMDQLSGNTIKKNRHFDSSDWIKFDENYLRQWTDCQTDPYEGAEHEDYKGWAMGKVYDSCYFPTSLAGARVRGPGRYHGTFWENGKTDTKRLLEGTEERIHSSVRARIDLGGRGIEDDWNQVFPKTLNLGPLIKFFWRKLTGQGPKPYQPQREDGPLHGWRLDDGHSSHRNPNWNIDMSPVDAKQINWVYEGTEPCSTRVMPEDKLGPFELELLQRDQKFANQIMVSNNAWKWYVTESRRSPRHGLTL